MPLFYKCDIVIYKKIYYVIVQMTTYIFLIFIHISWLTHPKTLRISQVLRAEKGVFFYVNKVVFGKHLRMKARCQWSQPCD